MRGVSCKGFFEYRKGRLRYYPLVRLYDRSEGRYNLPENFQGKEVSCNGQGAG